MRGNEIMKTESDTAALGKWILKLVFCHSLFKRTFSLFEFDCVALLTIVLLLSFVIEVVPIKIVIFVGFIDGGMQRC